MLQTAGDIHLNPGPPCRAQPKELSIIHINARSLRRKLDLLDSEVTDHDVITISETWLSTDIKNNEISINGYHPPVRKDRSDDPHGVKNSLIKNSLFMSNKGSDPGVIPSFEKDGVTYYTNEEKATILNQFFINQSTTEDNDDTPDVLELLTSINQINLSVEEVKSTLTKLITAKATAPDQIHNLILKNSAGIISEPLTFLFNRSLNEGIFPTVWKTAHVTPIYKKKVKRTVY